MYCAAFGLQLLLGLANPRDFREGVDHPRNRVEVDVRLLADNALGHSHAFVFRLVGEHRATHHVADGPQARHLGLAVVVHLDEAARVHAQAHRFQIQVVGVRHAADGHDQAVHFQRLGLAVLVVIADGGRCPCRS